MSQFNFYIVGVGASAGGQAALKEFFSAIPADTPAAFVVVTHLSRDFKSSLHDIIAGFTKLKVSKIGKYTKPEPGRVYVMPEDVVAKMENGFLTLVPRPQDNVINKSINIFFESLAKEQQSKAIGVVLSGMGNDGAEGALKIFLEGGDILVQDPASTPFNSMPVATILKDHPDFILPPKELGLKVAEMIKMKSDDKSYRHAS
jgi:chemotaxis response regulator CheB